MSYEKLRVLSLLLVIVMINAIFTGCSQNNRKQDEMVNSANEVSNGEVKANEDTETSQPVSEYGITINEDNVVFTDARGEEVTIKESSKSSLLI